MNVKVHRNLHKRCWSLRVGNHVVAHALNVTLTNCTFHVSEAGRRRVLARQRKNVHAYVQGTLVKSCGKRGREITYNPYVIGKFVYRATGKPVAGRVTVHFTDDGKAYARAA